MSDPLWLRIVLLVLDKLVLAGVVAAAVLFGQRWLEGYKSRQAIVQGLVKMRIDAIAKLCDDLSKIEDELYETDRRYFEILIEQAPLVAKSVRTNDEFKDRFPDAVDQIATPELKPRLEKVRVDLTRFGAQLAQPTFLVPESVTKLLKEHIDSLSALRKLHSDRVLKKLYVPPADVDASAQAVGRKRLTLDKVLQRLVSDA